MKETTIRNACFELGYEDPISVEPDGTVWLGIDPDREYPDMQPINAKVAELEAKQAADKDSGRAKLAALGLTQDEINALLGV